MSHDGFQTACARKDPRIRAGEVVSADRRKDRQAAGFGRGFQITQRPDANLERLSLCAIRPRRFD